VSAGKKCLTPNMRTDEEVDDFYSVLLRDYNVRAQWDLADSVVRGRYVMDYDLGIYSTVLWHSDTRYDASMASDTTSMRKYLEAGGNLWLSGWRVIWALMGEESQEDYHFNGGGFIPNYLGIDSVTTTSNSDIDFIGAHSLIGGFPSVRVDSEKVALFGGLFNMEVLLPPFNGSDPLYSYISSDSLDSAYHGLPVAVLSNTTDYGLIFTDFPVFFIDTGGADTLAQAVMGEFGEPVLIDGGEKTPSRLPRAFVMGQNHPNPFNPSTEISYDVPMGSGDGVRVMLDVFDIRGRRIATLVDAKKEPGSYRVHWNGCDDRGRRVSSGVYLYRLKSGPFTAVRKMVVTR